ncbi:MAG: putative AAA+ superfamily ATPase, partial [Saprospiraceae bacterium]
SILDIMKGYADLSRRAVHYTLQGMSFREYLYFETGTAYDIYDIATLVKNGFKEEVESPLYHFNRYLNKGYYPFYKEPDFELRLLSVVNTILEVDLIQYLDLRPSTTAKLKKLLQIISESVPFKPNLTKIAELTGISRSLLLDYIKYLERAGLISLLNTSTKGIQALGKPEKIYLNNTNLNYALGGQLNTNLGNVRETFFMSQLAMQTEVTIPEKGDFLVSNYCFEVGGRSKTKKQIQGVENAFVVKDDIEFSQGNIIPLWHFGFLY